ncbi:glycosyltransferase [Paenibacillaceae bacterium]|nr:glycosyltransferase [Paenibacillaceae bacterium]
MRRRRLKKIAVRLKKRKLARKSFLRRKLKRKLYKKRIRARRRRRAKHVAPVPAPVPPPAVQEAPPAPPQPEPPAHVPHNGVNLIGFIRAQIGLGESSRIAAKALSTTDIPFGIIDFPIPTRVEDISWAHKEIPHAIYATNLLHMNADSLLHARMHFGEGLFNDRNNIGYWHWELPDFPDENLPAFDLVREVWAPTSFVQESIAKKSPIPVIRIPHGIDVETSPDLNRTSFGLPANRFLFFMMYDVQSHTARKNPQAVIEAFKQAFAVNSPHVGLVLKFNNADFQPADIEELRSLVHGYDNIFMIDSVLSRIEVNSLLNSTDCFVSLHRSEGFGLGLAEAMFLGKPAIGTNWSGNTDFMNENNSCPVNYQLVQVGQDWGPYKAYQTWAEPDLQHAAALMRRLIDDPNWRQSIAANGQHTIRTEFSPQVVGQMIRSRLIELGII